MSQSSSGSMLLSRAFVGFLQAKEAEGCSLRTVDGYRRELQKWLAHLGDQAVASISTEHVRAYLSYLRTSYTPLWQHQIDFLNPEHPLSLFPYF